MPSLKILACAECDLVQLSSKKHIQKNHYINSGMHKDCPISINKWLQETDADDERRILSLKTMVTNKNVLDFGCGAGGFLLKAKKSASAVAGVELEKRVVKKWRGKIKIFPNIKSITGQYDLVTAFHVLEHLADPRMALKMLSKKLASEGRIVVEVPNSEDALLTLYNCRAFQNFTYWSQHLYLFNASTLKILAKQAGLNILSVQHIQRYSTSNHLYWLNKGKPGGHKEWAFLDSPGLRAAYENSLAKIGKTDTILAFFEK